MATEISRKHRKQAALAAAAAPARGNGRARRAVWLGFLLHIRSGWLAAAIVLVAGVGVVPAAAATGGGRAQVADTISTVVGGVGGPARATRVALTPCGVTVADGSVYAGTGGAVRRVSSAGQLTTLAGTGATGLFSDGGPAASASLNGACGVAVDRSGNLVISDASNNRVRVVAAATGTFYGQAMTAGHIYTIAGDGIAEFSGDGGPGTGAELNVLIADYSNNRVREVAR